MTGPGSGAMFFVPMNVYGKTRLVAVPINAQARDYYLAEQESTRVVMCAKRREYYAGEQYAVENADCAASLGLDPVRGRLPEHKRQHAYSTQIQQCVDYLSDRISEGWLIEAEDSSVQAVLDAMIQASPQLSAESETGEMQAVTDDVLRDAMQTGDVAAYVGWDPVKQVPLIELWESENVEVRWLDTLQMEMVIRREMLWVLDEQGMERQVTGRQQFTMRMNAFARMECVRETYWDSDDQPRRIDWLGVGRIPWQLLRSECKGLRDTRGQSPISDQLMEAADRLNAVEQVGYRISRYNSHGNLAVIGDEALLRLDQDKRISKDVADVLTFPGGTALQAITLPTDPQMIVHQVGELKDSIIGSFGLVRVDPETWQGLGAVSGYALEILNTKTESTFKRIRRQWRKDWTSLCNLVLDVAAWRTQSVAGFVHPMTGEFVPFLTSADPMLSVPAEAQMTVAFWDVDPMTVFPNRQVKITMGTGYIVDDVLIRDDFVQGLISHEEALRQRGFGDDDVTRILEEIDNRKTKDAETEAAVFQASAAASVAAAAAVGATVAPSETAAGSTVSDTGGQQSQKPAATSSAQR